MKNYLKLLQLEQIGARKSLHNQSPRNGPGGYVILHLIVIVFWCKTTLVSIIIVSTCAPIFMHLPYTYYRELMRFKIGDNLLGQTNDLIVNDEQPWISRLVGLISFREDENLVAHNTPPHRADSTQCKLPSAQLLVRLESPSDDLLQQRLLDGRLCDLQCNKVLSARKRAPDLDLV